MTAVHLTANMVLEMFLVFQGAHAMFDFSPKHTPRKSMAELERFIEFWLGPRKEEYGEPETSLNQLKLPEPLRRLYRFAGQWPGIDGHSAIAKKYGWVGIFSTQDMLLRPSHLQWTDDGKVIFLRENQGVWQLAANAEGDDSPVWCDMNEVGVDRISEWPQVHDSLAQLLITYCFQELTFSCRFGEWDTALTAYFKSGEANIVPLWQNGIYVWPEAEFSFYLMDGEVLVANFAGMLDEDTYYFGANSPAGIAILQAREAPIIRYTVQTPSQWNVTINTDGSAEVGVFTKPDAKAICPPGTFDFEALRDRLLACRKEDGTYRVDPTICFFRADRGSAKGELLTDWDLVRQVFAKAFQHAENKGPDFDSCTQSIPLEHE